MHNTHLYGACVYMCVEKNPTLLYEALLREKLT